MSIRRGLRPSIQTRPARARSLTEGARSPKPKSTSAARSVAAFFRSGATNTSRSSVNRGSPWTAIACPPIKRNRVPAEISATKNACQSSLRRNVPEPIPAEPFDDGEALFRRGSRDVVAIKPLTFLQTRGADDTLDAHRHQHARRAGVRPLRVGATSVRPAAPATSANFGACGNGDGRVSRSSHSLGGSRSRKTRWCAASEALTASIWAAPSGSFRLSIDGVAEATTPLARWGGRG